jgi:hypothetical protein
MAPIITIPVDFASSTLAYVGQLFTDLAPILYLVVGLYVAFWVASKVIALARGGFRSRRV